MSSDLERRLEGLLAEVPEPEPGVGEAALTRALSALRPHVAPRRGLRTAVLVFAAVLVLLAVAAGSLAAAGALHVSIGPKPKPPPRPVAATTQLSLPKGASGIAAVVDGRLSVVKEKGFRLQGLPVTAATLSPHALYVAAGVGNSLVALGPGRRTVWSHPAGGKVVAIAWAPDAIRIAYLVRSGRRLALHIIWGTGTHDVLVDRNVRAVRPSWRADSLALAYVGGGGRAVVYDLGHESRQLAAVSPPATGVAFAPSGDALAVAGTAGVSLVHNSSYRHIAAGDVEAFGWLHGRLAVAVPGADSARIRLFSPNGVSRGSYPVNGTVVAVTPRMVVVQRGQDLVASNTTLLTVSHGAAVRDLAVG